MKRMPFVVALSIFASDLAAQEAIRIEDKPNETLISGQLPRGGLITVRAGETVNIMSTRNGTCGDPAPLLRNLTNQINQPPREGFIFDAGFGTAHSGRCGRDVEHRVVGYAAPPEYSGNVWIKFFGPGSNEVIAKVRVVPSE